MDSKQAAATLLKAAQAIPQFADIDAPTADVAEAAEIGAEAIEMMDWLFTKSDDPPLYNMRWCCVDWTEEQDFRAYCEARFREYKKGLSKNG